jgi:hypothetical protein
MKHLFYIFIFLMTCTFSLQAQDSTKNKKLTKAAVVKKEITNKDFVFVAKWLTPMSGRMRQLTDPYDVRISNDTLVAYLPFFGRSYVAPDDPSNISINFTSTKFTYTVSNRKKGGWDILIKFDDQKDFNSFAFTVFDDGTAYLNITSMNSDPISYNGYVEERSAE